MPASAERKVFKLAAEDIYVSIHDRHAYPNLQAFVVLLVKFPLIVSKLHSISGYFVADWKVENIRLYDKDYMISFIL